MSMEKLSRRNIQFLCWRTSIHLILPRAGPSGLGKKERLAQQHTLTFKPPCPTKSDQSTASPGRLHRFTLAK
eukprot:g76809.t1